MRILEIITGIFVSIWKSAAEITEHFIQTQSLPEKYSDAHKLLVPVFIVFVLIIYFLDKYDSAREKLIYTFYFLLFIEAVVFMAVFTSILAQ